MQREFHETHNHEEADTLIVRHAYLAATTPSDEITVLSPDTDVFVLLLAFVSEIPATIFMAGVRSQSLVG